MHFIKLTGTNKNIYHFPASSIICLEQLPVEAIPIIGSENGAAAKRCAIRIKDVQGIVEVAHSAEEVIKMIGKA